MYRSIRCSLSRCGPVTLGVIDDSTINDICVGHAKHGTIDPFARQLQGADPLKENGQRKCCPLFFCLLGV
jgi:hypothetical protein